MRVTMKDIAARAGVVQSAVSAVLNGTTASRVSPETREKILRISREMNYRPNFAATALKKQKTGLIGLICGGLNSPYYSELTTAVTEMAALRGYRVMLTLMSFSNKMDMNDLNRMFTNMCDGIIMSRELSTEKELIQETVKAGNLPFVMMGSIMDDLNSVSFDYSVGMEKAFDELLSHGHRTIAFAGHVGDVSKLQAYRESCVKYHCEPVEYAMRIKHSLEDAFERGVEIADNRARHTALITTDYSLSLLYPGMNSRGLTIPRDLSVVAFNDTRLSRCFVPALTSISFNTGQIARYSIDILLDLIENQQDKKVKSVIIPPELIRRNSVVHPAI